MSFGLKFAISAPDLHYSKPGGSDAASLHSGQHVLSIVSVIDKEISDFREEAKQILK